MKFPTSVLIVLGGLALALGFQTAARADAVTNGDFATGDFTGWTLGGEALGDYVTPTGSVGEGDTAFNAPDAGAYYVALGADTDTTLSQNLVTVDGQSYTFSFYFGTDGNSDDFTAYWNGSAVFNSFDDSAFGTSAPNLVLESFTVVATGTNTTIEFDAGDSLGHDALDNISVVPTPEPAALIPLSVCMAGLAGNNRRRRKRSTV